MYTIARGTARGFGQLRSPDDFTQLRRCNRDGVGQRHSRADFAQRRRNRDGIGQLRNRDEFCRGGVSC